MNVREVIAELQKYDPELPVIVMHANEFIALVGNVEFEPNITWTAEKHDDGSGPAIFIRAMD